MEKKRYGPKKFPTMKDVAEELRLRHPVAIKVEKPKRQPKGKRHGKPQ